MVTIDENEHYILLHDEQKKSIALAKKLPAEAKTWIAEADFFFYPDADRTSLLSNLVLHERHPEAIHFMMLSIEHWMEKYHARFFSLVPHEDTHLFFSPDIACRSEPDNFIMLQSQDSMREADFSFIPDVIAGLEVIVGDTPESKALFIRERDQFCHLLQETYWGKSYSPDMTEHRIRSAAAVMALKQGDQYIGFVRFLSNGSLGFISDMVIDEQCRGKGYSNYLVKQLTQLAAYQKVHHTLLTTPVEGAGKESAPRVYLHFGFKKVSNESDLLSDRYMLLYIWKKQQSSVATALRVLGD